MNLVFLVNHFPPGEPIGGIVSYTALMARAWARAGHDVTVLCQAREGVKKREEERPADGLRVIRLPPRPYPGQFADKLRWRFRRDNSYRMLFHKEFSWALFREIDSWPEKPDLVEAPEAFAWPYFLLKKGAVPVVLRPHGPNFLARKADPENALLHAAAVDELEMFCLKKARARVAITRFMARELEKKGLPVRAVLPLPLEAPGPDLPPKEDRLVAAGRLIPGKGFDTAIELLAKLEAKWSLCLLGPDGPDGRGGSYRERLETLARRLGCDSRVTFTGPLERREVLRHLARARFLVHDSANDNMPYVILEALSVNTFVLASRVGGIPETLQGAGALLPKGDVAAYLEALHGADFRPTAGEVLRRHHPSRLQEALEKLYREVLRS
jgi:glycosyltransferase involved in cell wall biosynthesis